MNFPLGCGQQVALGGDGWTHQAQCVGGRFGQGCLLLPHVQQAQPQAFLVVRTDGDPVSLSTAIREAVRSVDAGQPVYSLASMDQHIANSLGPRRFAVHLLGLFAGIAVLMAALGLYGVIRYTVAQRTQEIGIRMTLGAQRAQVLSLVVGHALRLAVAGVVAGAVAAFVLAQLPRQPALRGQGLRSRDLRDHGAGAARGSLRGQLRTRPSRDPSGPDGGPPLRVKRPPPGEVALVC